MNYSWIQFLEIRDTFVVIRVKKENQLVDNQSIGFVNPLGIEPRAKEPESFILSIKLRVLFRLQKY